MTSTTPARLTPDESGPRPLPIWASVPIVLVSLAVGGWIIHWYVGTRVRADEPRLLGDPAAVARGTAASPGPGFAAAAAGGGNRANARRVVTKVRADGDRTSYEAHTGTAQLRWVSFAGGKPPQVTSVTYFGGDRALAGFVPDPVLRTIRGAAQMTDGAAAKATGLTAEQARKLQPLAGTGTMRVSDADRATLSAAVTAYLAAAAANREATARAALLSTLDAIAARSRTATRDEYADRAAKINAIVTPEQWKQYRAFGGQP